MVVIASEIEELYSFFVVGAFVTQITSSDFFVHPINTSMSIMFKLVKRIIYDISGKTSKIILNRKAGCRELYSSKDCAQI